ncbi:hypothetical protein CYY_006814 [Polysphondylium violaceum]|uniref:beta-mannosidase n=1 Tax=Polysphondylium violaceum TaxID=133409 RepID=A0A8J4UY14_9MYCE|nr:hypothetical protein CYY_006814 [Polysphondylium violaceum]
MNSKYFKIDLCGEWTSIIEKYRNSYNGDDGSSSGSSILGSDSVISSIVPGEIHMDLLRNNLISDPYKGEKELLYRWIAESDWRFIKNFDIKKEEWDHINQHFTIAELVCQGIDTIADIVINGQQVARVENMFVEFKFDIKKYLLVDRNKIEVIIYSPERYCKEQSQKYQYQVPEWEYPNGVHHRNFIRKCECHFGWDWGPCFCPMGIYKEIFIQCRTVPLLDKVKITQDHSKYGQDQSVELKIDITLSEILSHDYLSLSIFDPDEKLISSIIVEPKDPSWVKSNNLVTINIEKANLWWPNGYGSQPLYRLETSIVSSKEKSERSIIKTTKYIGLRSIQVDTSKDAFGSKFQIVVNSVPIFAKGSDWIPADHFLTRIEKSTIKHLLSSAKESNMNCLRLWGGGVYETDHFYQLCDKYGLLVWHDFMFGCALYPTNKEFLENVKREVVYQVNRIGHHACIALWCGSNESEQAISEKLWDPIKQCPERYLLDFNKLYIETIQPTLSNTLEGSFFWLSSPSNGVGVWGNTNDDTQGDTHYWAVWHSDMPFTQYLKSKSRFLSEFGFQSLPSCKNLKTVVGANELNITSTEMENRQRSPKPGNVGILKHVGLHFRVPSDFEHFCYVTQILQAISIKTGCEHWRRMKPYCMGTLYWQLNDIWVGPSWSSIEYNGDWKALQYFAKHFYNPLLVSFAEDLDNPDQLEIWITHDYNSFDFMLNGELVIQIYDLSNGLVEKEISSHSFSIETCQHAESSKVLAPLSKSVLFGDLKKHRGHYIILAKLQLARETIESMKTLHISINHSYENVYYPCPFKQLVLKKTKITLSSNGVGIKGQFNFVVESQEAAAVALFVWISTDKDGHFSDNGFTLFKSSTKKITFYPKSKDSSLDITDFKVYSLVDTFM